MSKPALTPNQRHVLDYVETHVERHGRPPSLREIAAALGFARHSSAQDYVAALVRKGALERLPQHRRLRLPATARSGTIARPGLPPISRVAAGQPTIAFGQGAHH